MDKFLKTKTQKALDGEIERIISKMSVTTNQEEYAQLADNLNVLCEARERKDPASISYEQLAAIGANLIGLLVILNFEKTGSITSKAFGWIWKK